MKHQQIKDLLSSYVDGELNPQQKLEIEKHIEQCSECRDFLNYLINLDQQVKKAVQKQEIPSDEYFRGLRAAILTQIPAKPEPVWKKYFSFLTRKEISAVAVMALVLVFVLAIRYVSDNFFEEIKPPQVQQPEGPRYSRFLPPEEMEHSFQIDEFSGEEISSVPGADEEISVSNQELVADVLPEEEGLEEEVIISRSVTEVTGYEELVGLGGGMDEPQTATETTTEYSDMTDNEDRCAVTVGGSVGETSTTLESPACVDVDETYYQHAEELQEQTVMGLALDPEFGKMDRDQMDSMVSYNLVMIFGDYLVRRNNRDSTVLNVYLDDRGYITDLSIEDGFNQRKIPPDVQELLSNTIGRRFEIDSTEVNDTLLKVKIFVDQ